MFNIWPFKKKNKQGTSTPDQAKAVEKQYDLKWYPVGQDNPYDAPILDLRPFALTVTSMMGNNLKDLAIYSVARESDGTNLIGTEPENPVRYQMEFIYPHNDEPIEGIVFKAPTMEVKWDIYAYEDWFYFVRSWTADLMFKAKFINEGNQIKITEVIATNLYSEQDAENIHSILLTHALGQVWPYHIPEALQQANPELIAHYMFSLYGSKATLATFESVRTIKIIGQ